ncbi:hypothetical protein AVEN_100686-1 [Araneus ventricosus]|uniref:Uncharacterized protein n=1 Tax=Araneus ventricosus TaxID=182803 RepID=A0A4Y2CST9_ARAVE|nr:hypothetical protein AVEN_100686-1 [Araneus ventricosus]
MDSALFSYRTPPHAPEPEAITATEPVEWTSELSSYKVIHSTGRRRASSIQSTLNKESRDIRVNDAIRLNGHFTLSLKQRLQRKSKTDAS